jgi:multidrug efflux pump subunit AcrB
MRNVIAWAVRSRSAMNLILIVAVLIGVVSLRLLKREVFPNFELDILMVQVLYPGASPEEVEEGICMKIEEAVRSIDGIKTTTAIARESMGYVVMELNANSDSQRILNEVRSQVDRIPSFPELAEDPEVQQITFRNPAIRLGLLASSSDAPNSEWQLRDLSEEIRNELLELPSVSQVNIVGERPYQIDVEISEETLRKYGLTLQKLASVLRRENVEIPGGKIQATGETVLLRGKNKRLTGEEIAKLPVVTQADGTVLTVADLGTVRDGFDDTISYSRVNGQSAMVLSVDRTSEEDLLRIVDEVKAYIAEKKLPAGYTMTIWNDTSIDVRERIELLTEDGLQGLVLVFLVLAIFLEFRLAMWVAMGIPFAILATCGLLYTTGDTLNMLTLFSFLMALGLLVDDAIVISENFHTHMEMGKSTTEAAIEAATEVAPSVIAGVFCTVIAFIPLFFVTGVMGKFIACMPLTVVGMLLISLVEGFTILPSHLGHDGMLQEMRATIRGLRQSAANLNPWETLGFGWLAQALLLVADGVVLVFSYVMGSLKRFFDGVNRRADRLVVFLVERAYLPTLNWLLKRIPLALALQFAFLVLTLTFFKAGWTRYLTFPEMDGRLIQANISYPDGTPAHVTDAGVRQATDAIRRLSDRFAAQGMPLVSVVHEAVGGTGGAPVGPDGRDSGEFVGNVNVELVGSEQRTLTSQQIVAMWREETGPIAGVEKAVFEMRSMGPGGKDIEFKMLASTADWPKLEQAVERTKDALARINGVYDISDDSYQGKWEYQIRMKDRGRSMGVTTADLAETVRAAFYGEEVMRLQRGRHEVKLMVRYPQEDRASIAALEQLRVRGNDNLERPITELAQFDIRHGYSEIQRIDQRRAITITANVEESITTGGQAIADLQKAFLGQLSADFPEVAIRWEGQKEQDNESMASLGLGSIVALGAMFILLTFQLESVVQPMMILWLIPFAIAGAIWGHIFMRLDVTLFSVFGLVALMGMVVNDSIVLLDFINARRAENPEEPLKTAILEASRRRIRPVALNTVTSVIGLIPLLADRSFQAQALIPMGVSLVFGLATATVLGLLILPTIYYLVEGALPKHRGHGGDHGAGRDATEDGSDATEAERAGSLVNLAGDELPRPGGPRRPVTDPLPVAPTVPRTIRPETA